jgi:hypothetical protein
MSPEERKIRNLQILQQYLPEGTAEQAYAWIQQYRFRFRISRSRHTRFGDYQAPHKPGELHRISVNHDLNPYAFLITFTHEVAHLITFEKYKDRVAPHGKEWKEEFSLLLQGFFNRHIFPQDVEDALKRYVLNPKASSCSDHALYRVLKKHDTKPVIHLEEIPVHSIFEFRNYGLFKKGVKRRTRYVCTHLQSKREYLISGIAEVKVLSMALPLEKI